jgi:hypothetical protein
MRWPRPRFTVRRLMITVAILAIGFGAIKWVAEMRARSAAYRRRAVEFRLSTLRTGSMFTTADGREVDRYDNENDRLMDAWAWRMEAKYRRLSYYPWRAAEPDPPPPRPLAHPRSALELPERDDSVVTSVRALRAPAWTFLWSWRRQGSAPWE